MVHSGKETASQRAAMSPEFSADEGESASMLMPMPQTAPSLVTCACHEVRLTRQVHFMWDCEPVQHLTFL